MKARDRDKKAMRRRERERYIYIYIRGNRFNSGITGFNTSLLKTVRGKKLRNVF